MIQQCEKAAAGEDDNLLKRWHRSNVEIVNAVEKSGGEEGKSYTAGSTKGPRILQRWVFAFMGCLAIANAYTMRISLSLAITEIVKTKEISSSNGTSSDDSCPSTNEGTSSASSNSGSLEWDEYTQGIILSSFYWGYVLNQLPGGIIADKFGGKYTLGLGILSTAIFSLVLPIVVSAYEATGLIVLRILMGFGEATTFPAVSVLIAKWAPPLERSKITSIIMSGMAVGTVVGNGLSGILIQASSIGWPIVFYFYGGLGVLWFLAWVILCYDDPEAHPFVSEEEKKYIRDSMHEHTHRKTSSTPWRHIMTSMPVWGLIAGKAGFSWGYYVILTDLPKYMSSVLKFSIEANGLLSALPYVILWFLGTTSSWLVDWLVKTDKMSRTNVRKACQTFASVIPALFIILASHAGCDRTLVVVLFTIGVGSMGPYYSSLMVNPNDLSPNNSGTLMAIGNGVGALAGILAPYVVGILTPNQTLAEWRLVFWITFAIFLASILVFDLCADGEVQYWNDLEAWNDSQEKTYSKNKNKFPPVLNSSL